MTFSFDDILEKFFHTETVHEYTLEKMQNACAFFGHPERHFKSIHIAGTNGKGSVSKMVFQVLKEAGKKVGVYTSPHYTSIRERFETEA
jgi:dihydrofolate synthase/folylpolyglutamate synthase